VRTRYAAGTERPLGRDVEHRDPAAEIEILRLAAPGRKGAAIEPCFDRPASLTYCYLASCPCPDRHCHLCPPKWMCRFRLDWTASRSRMSATNSASQNSRRGLRSWKLARLAPHSAPRRPLRPSSTRLRIKLLEDSWQFLFRGISRGERQGSSAVRFRNELSRPLLLQVFVGRLKRQPAQQRHSPSDPVDPSCIAAASCRTANAGSTYRDEIGRR
jgi:hypothetical protein